MAGSIAKAYVQIVPSADGIKGKLSNVFNGEMPSAGQNAGGIFGSNLISKIKWLIAAAGLGKLLSDSIMAGANLEQSLGGIETLFKDSADIVIKNAEQAYKTAGMSANAYMETVTGFSASLLQGLSGDTEAAAAVADMALTDMSDNANKMGADMKSIQNAYQGFAKQNYTMLDNLKLGYGGTKSEMERLLADAQKLTGVEYDMSNLADVYSAIHAIQEEMDITGTTAKEAASTLSGSLSSMKAAFSDVLANLSLGRDIGPSLTALGETVFTFVSGNLMPMVGNILSTLPQVLDSVLTMAIRGLNLIADNAGTIVQIGIELVTGIGRSIITALPYLAEAALNIVVALGKAIINTDWLQLGKDTINGLKESLDIAAGEILGTDGNIVQSVLNAISTELPMVLESGGTIISNLLDGIFEYLPKVLSMGTAILNQLVSGIFASLPSLVQMALDVAVSFINSLVENLPEILNAGKDILLNVVDGIRQAFPDILKSAGDAVASLLSGLVENLPDILAAGFDLIVSLIEGIGNACPDIIAAAGKVTKNLWDAIKKIDWLQLGKDIINGLIKGIGAMNNALWNAAKNIAKSALDAIKKFFGIASPSKVMRDQVGKFIPAGVAVGIETNTKPLTDAMHDLSILTTDTLNADLSLDDAISAQAAPGCSYGDSNITIHVYAAENQDVDELAEILMQKIQFAVSRKEACFA